MSWNRLSSAETKTALQNSRYIGTTNDRGLKSAHNFFFSQKITYLTTKVAQNKRVYNMSTATFPAATPLLLESSKLKQDF